jgi:hypothetical protein
MRYLLVFLLLFPMEELRLPNGVTQIDDWQSSELAAYYKRVPKKFFGWSSVLIYDEEPAVYVSETLFSYANQSNDSVKYTYSHTNDESRKYQVNVTGNITTSTAGQIKDFKLKFDSSVKSTIAGDTQSSTNTKMNLNIEVPAYRKVSLKLRGEARLSSGVGVYYVMWMPVRRGAFEVLDVISEHFWLKEELL